MTSKLQPPTVSLKERLAALQQRNNANPASTALNHSPSPSHHGALRDKIAQFEQKGSVPVPRGSFGLGAPPTVDGAQGKRTGELYGNRVSGLNRPSGPPPSSMSRSGSPLPQTPNFRKLSLSVTHSDRSPSSSSSPSSPRPTSPALSDTNTDDYAFAASRLSRRNSFAAALDFAKKMEESALANGIGLPFTGDWFGNPIFSPRASPTRDGTSVEDVAIKGSNSGEEETSFDLSLTEIGPTELPDDREAGSSTSLTFKESIHPLNPLEANATMNDPSIGDSSQAPETPALPNIPETVVEVPKTSMDTIRPSDFQADRRSSFPHFDEEKFLGMPTPVIVVEQGSEISNPPLHEIVPDGLRTPSSPGLDPQILVDEVHPPSPGDILPASIMSPTSPEHLPSPPHSDVLVFTSEVDVTEQSPPDNLLKENTVENDPDPGEEVSLPHLGSADTEAANITEDLEASARDSSSNEDAQHQNGLIEDHLIRDALPQNSSSKFQRPTPTRLLMPVRARPSGPRVLKAVGGKESSIYPTPTEHVFQPESAPVTEETSRRPNPIIDDKPSVTEAGRYLITESPDKRLSDLTIDLSFPFEHGLSPVRETENDELPSPESYNLRTPSWGSSCATPTRPFSTFEVAEAHVYTPITSRAFPVFIPPENQQKPEEDVDEKTEGHSTIIEEPSPSPEALSDLNGSAKPNAVVFKAVVHKKVTELPAIAAGPRDSFYNSLTRAQRNTKTESVLRNPAYGELVSLLQESAMLEKTLSEGNVPNEEGRPSDGHHITSNSSPNLLLPTTSSNKQSPTSTAEKLLPPTPSPKSSKTSLYLSTLRRLKETASVMRSPPGHGHKPSSSRSTSISSEVSSSDFMTIFSQSDNGISFPASTSSSPRRNGLSRAVSFADRLLQRVRTKSSVSEIHAAQTTVQQSPSMFGHPNQSSPMFPVGIATLPRSAARQVNWPPPEFLQPAPRPSFSQPKPTITTSPITKTSPTMTNPPATKTPPSAKTSPTVSSLSDRPVSSMSSRSSSSSSALHFDKEIFESFPRVPQHTHLTRSFSPSTSRTTPADQLMRDDPPSPRQAASFPFRPRIYSHA